MPDTPRSGRPAVVERLGRNGNAGCAARASTGVEPFQREYGSPERGASGSWRSSDWRYARHPRRNSGHVGTVGSGSCLSGSRLRAPDDASRGRARAVAMGADALPQPPGPRPSGPGPRPSSLPIRSRAWASRPGTRTATAGAPPTACGRSAGSAAARRSWPGLPWPPAPRGAAARASRQREATSAALAVTSSHARTAKAGLAQQRLVGARRHEEVEADRAPGGELLVRDRAGDHHRVGEQRAAAGPQHPVPVAQHGRAVARCGTWRRSRSRRRSSVGEGQRPAGVHRLEPGPVGEAASLGERSPALRTPCSLMSTPVTRQPRAPAR